jgi:hypothetical protein
MATLLSAIETDVRRDLKEASASFWSSAELVVHFNAGIQNLWGAIIDLFEEHYITVDITNVSMAADATTLTGVPADTFRVHLIEPRDTTSAGSAPNVLFVPKEYNGRDFANARSQAASDPSNGLSIFFQVTGPGYPVGTPTVQVAPKISSALNLRFVYVPGIAVKVAADDNPIPGQSDRALHAYCMAFALAKEQEDKMPHPGWLQVFKTEKELVLQRLTPRQTQDVLVVEDMFGGYMESEGY